MKKALILSLLFVFAANTVTIALPNRPLKEKTEAVSSKALKKAQKQEQKWNKKKEKLDKKLKKIEKKLAKKGIKATQASSVWNDETFKLGALIGLGGLLLTILGVLPILGGIFTFIGTLMLLVGLGLMIWVLIDSQ